MKIRADDGLGDFADPNFSTTNGIKTFRGAVGSTTLFLGGLGVLNVMPVAVRERAREIGCARRWDASAKHYDAVFLETMIVVFVSGGPGVTISFGLCASFNLLPISSFFAGLLPTWQSAAISLGLLGTVAVLAAMYPVRQAPSIDPIEALRYKAVRRLTASSQGRPKCRTNLRHRSREL